MVYCLGINYAVFGTEDVVTQAWLTRISVIRLKMCVIDLEYWQSGICIEAYWHTASIDVYILAFKHIIMKWDHFLFPEFELCFSTAHIRGHFILQCTHLIIPFFNSLMCIKFPSVSLSHFNIGISLFQCEFLISETEHHWRFWWRWRPTQSLNLRKCRVLPCRFISWRKWSHFA